MRILVTNDDGIDSIGLHVLARSICELDGGHEVVVAAPDQEYSGAGAALGALHLIQPEVRRAQISNCPADAIWKVSGPPALCVFFADSERSVVRSILSCPASIPAPMLVEPCTTRARLAPRSTGRNGHISGIAISQAVTGFGVEGQGWDESIATQHWDSAAAVAKQVAQTLVDDMPTEPVVVNINVPDTPLDQFGTWKYAYVGDQPPRSMSAANLKPIPGHEEAYTVEMGWGDVVELAPHTDGGIIERNDIAITYLTRLDHHDRPDLDSIAASLDELLG